MSRYLPPPIDIDGYLRSNGKVIQQGIVSASTRNTAPGSKQLIQVLHPGERRARRQLKVIRRTRPYTAEQLTVVRDELVEGWQFWPEGRETAPGCMTERESGIATVLAADLYWVGEKMCQMLYSAAPGIEFDTTIPNDLVVPSHSGLVFLERPWRGGIDSATGDPTMIVDLFTWTHTAVGLDKLPCLSISCYRYIDFRHLTESDVALMGAIGLDDYLGDYLPYETQVVEGHGTARILAAGHWAPLGRTDWPIDHELGDVDSYMQEGERVTGLTVAEDYYVGWAASTIQDRQILAAFFALLQSDRLAEVTEHRPSRQVVRAAQRRKQPVPSPVKIVVLRRPKHAKTGREGTTGRKVSYQFPVRSHPRKQACGKGRKDRKLIIVPAHTRGPDDGLFIPKETVFKLIR